MDIVTSSIISGAVYDMFKKGIAFTKDKISEKLSEFITNEESIKLISEKLSNLQVDDEMSEIAIKRKIDGDPEILKLIANLESKGTTTINQQHLGQGDNVGGNKIINNGK